MPWKIVEGSEFIDLKTVLDNIMQERAQNNINKNKCHAKLITYAMEDDLWARGFLGEDTPEKLCTTCYYGISMGFFLRAVSEHYNLRRWTPEKESQITFERDPNGVRCVVYREDKVSKTHDGGLKDMRRDRKEVWIHPNTKKPERDYVHLIEKYLGLCPPLYAKNNFYFQVLNKPTPACWYANQVMGEQSIGKIIGKVMENVGYEGFYSGHSLRRSGGSRLFNAGVQRKLIKECTGHSSDAVDQYQITSAEQRATMSNILAHGVATLPTQSNVELKSVCGTAVDTTVHPPPTKSEPDSAESETKPNINYTCGNSSN